MLFDLAGAPPAAADLDIIARELARVGDFLVAAAADARALADATDWQARAATAFHDEAERWSHDISSLVCLAETAMIEAAAARDLVWLRMQDSLG